MVVITFPPPPLPPNSEKTSQQQYIEWLWIFLPGIIDEHNYRLASESVMQQYYNAFYETCGNDTIVDAFNYGVKQHGYPGACKHDTIGCQYWSTTFARSVYLIKFSNRLPSRKKEILWESLRLSIWDTVFQGIDHWHGYTRLVFNKARRLESAWRIEVKAFSRNEIPEIPEGKARRQKQEAVSKEDKAKHDDEDERMAEEMEKALNEGKGLSKETSFTEVS
ncbi:hypothetical protein HBH64_090150 [Parastagonospora nodorum]|nr:hypothetical protein HBH52_122350 [Parastagonospora nodorum]KAH4211435.1 hypothetical protein HBI95_056580 [Parastagonospora nodorum]KAH4288074.1 hypothetical protein HBI01_224170 [Parastagonospora nodorum]KAH4305112.1 hypothetical protein HBI02_123150 [Parastagonospora nodorum]KAH4323745.1 hypothetical protein HBI00_177920 [Parastagonospora nodorum]